MFALIRCHSQFKVRPEELTEDELAMYWNDLKYYLSVVHPIKWSE